MELNDLLRAAAIDPKRTFVLRHRPIEPRFRRMLPLLAGAKLDLFEAYQSYQGPQMELSFAKRLGGHLASFIEYEPGKAVFVALYAIADAKPITREQFWAIPEQIELHGLGNPGWTEAERREERLHFDLRRLPNYEDWRGKLIIEWPPHRSWGRRANETPLPVLAIREDSAFAGELPPWEQLDYGWAELQVLPTRMKAALEQWRGIYLIWDERDGRSYVGSAYGSTNLLGRWTSYAASGHGGNKRLRGRDPSTFRFSILQRVSPDLDQDEVVRLEATWKLRLHTRSAFGLNEN
ncbi:GIY-YIG nuclease family protein [Novosphingopyxis sp.]|uniref:GIY-YIG nuclease family protein n=1 Tax=Novosphingopyxis sp. TaxID=2709690 RepID=UPI003B5CCE84